MTNEEAIEVLQNLIRHRRIVVKSFRSDASPQSSTKDIAVSGTNKQIRALELAIECLKKTK